MRFDNETLCTDKGHNESNAQFLIFISSLPMLQRRGL